MRRRNILFFFVCLLVCCSFGFSQDKPVAVKVADYNEKTEKIESLTEKTNFFLKKLSESPKTTKGFVAAPANDSTESLYKHVKSILVKNEELKNRVEFLEHGPGDLNTKHPEILEFWLIPLGVEEPYYNLGCGLVSCPTIEIVGYNPVSDKNKRQIFTANVSGGSGDDVTYQWTLSEGEIISGQGTPVIEVDFSKVEVEEIIITIEVGGFGKFCKTKIEYKIKIVKQK